MAQLGQVMRTCDAPPSPREADTAVDARMRELAQVMEAYNEVTKRLEESHELLTAEVRRLRSELASANAALQRSKRLAALGEMAAGIAHEIRNPLGSIQLYANMLEQDLRDQPAGATAAKIGACVRGLDGVVSDVLAFARELRLRMTTAEAGAIFERAMATLGPVIDAAGVAVRVTGDTTTPIRHDPDLLNQALVNLLRNAVEAMAESPGRGTRLTLRAWAGEDGEAQLIVADSGPGIADEAIDRIFNPFFTTRQTGTGLGLAIVHRIVDAHGGTIVVHNDTAGEYGGGAVFTLSLPGEPRDGGVQT